MRHAQLDLFAGSRELCRLRLENKCLKARLETAKDAYRTLREERNALAVACGELQGKQEDLGQQLRAVRATARMFFTQRLEAEDRLVTVTQERDFWRGMASGQAAPRSQPGRDIGMRSALRQLIAVCHPDRWSQGQPATELAHELSVAVNALRERLGVA